MSFQLVQGVSADNLEGIHSAYCICANGISAVLSAELIGKAVEDLLKSFEEPVFFFVELPCSDDEEKKFRKSKTDPFHYNLYYLDNCTLSVADAIMKCYGDLLINDGLCRFGFGSHKNGEEIYCLNYQNISVYGEAAKFEPVFAGLGAAKEDEIKNLWDNFTKDTPGTSLSVEINGETVYDIPVKLKSEGMYLSYVIEEN